MQSGRALAVAVTLAGSSNIVRMLRQLSSTLKETTFLQWLLLKDETLSGSRSASSAGVGGCARCRGHLHLFLYFFAALCSPSWSSAFVFFNLFSSSVLATMVICISFFLFLQLCARYHGRPHFFRLTKTNYWLILLPEETYSLLSISPALNLLQAEALWIIETARKQVQSGTVWPLNGDRMSLPFNSSVIAGEWAISFLLSSHSEIIALSGKVLFTHTQAQSDPFVFFDQGFCCFMKCPIFYSYMTSKKVPSKQITGFTLRLLRNSIN